MRSLITISVILITISCSKSSSEPRTIRPQLQDIKDFVLEHAPYKQFNPYTGEYQLGQTPDVACEVIRFLYYYLACVAFENDVYNKIISLADFVLSMQNLNSGDFHFGAIPSSDSDNYFYSFSASLFVESMIYVHRLTNLTKFKTAAVNAGKFLRTMQTPNEQGFPFGDNSTWDSNNNPIYTGGICEFYFSSDAGESLSNDMHTRDLIVLYAFKLLYEESGNNDYLSWAEDLKNFLFEGIIAQNGSNTGGGLKFGYEYFDPNSFWGGSNRWHRVNDGISEKYIYGDTATYSIRALFQFQGFNSDIRQIYNIYNQYSADNYDPDICWAGYLQPLDHSDSGNYGTTPPSPDAYYDVVNLGILLHMRYFENLPEYDLSLNALLNNYESMKFWAVDYNFNNTITEWQDLTTFANIGEALCRTSPFL